MRQNMMNFPDILQHFISTAQTKSKSQGHAYLIVALKLNYMLPDWGERSVLSAACLVRHIALWTAFLSWYWSINGFNTVRRDCLFITNSLVSVHLK